MRLSNFRRARVRGAGDVMKLRRLVALVLTLAFLAQVQPTLHASAAAASPAPQAPVAPPSTIVGTAGLVISGTILRDGHPAAKVRLQVRNLDKNTIAGRMVSDSKGEFSFTVTEPGLYIVEAVKEDQSVIATGTPLTLTATQVTTQVILPGATAAALFFS